jgi:hypothetical protein
VGLCVHSCLHGVMEKLHVTWFNVVRFGVLCQACVYVCFVCVCVIWSNGVCCIVSSPSVLLVYCIFSVSDVLGPYGQWEDWSRTKDGGSFGRARTVTSAGPSFLSLPFEMR